MRTHPVALLRVLACGALLASAAASAAPPVITQQPATVVATSGTAGTFSVTATATGSISYQWRHLGHPVTNGTGPSLTLNAVTMVDAGLYDVVVTAGGESTTSQAGRLITTPTQYADQFCLDDSFLPLIETTGASAQTVAADPITGGFYVGGEFSTIDGVRRWNLARFDANGIIDPAFTPQVDGKVLTIAVQPNGKVLIGGAFRFVNNVQRGGIARLNTDGSLDRTFGNNRGFDGEVTCIGLQSTGRIVVRGPTSYDNLSKLQYTSFLRLLPDGTVDHGFSASASPQSPWFVIDRQDRILFRGYSWDGSLVRLTANGVKDTTFNAPMGLGTIYSLAVQQDGRPVLVGFGFVQRLQADGSIDAGFSISGFSVSPDELPAVIAVDDTDNTLINCDSKLLRVRPDGTQEPSFAVSMEMQRCITVLPGGRIAAVGQTQVGVKLLNPDGAPERSATTDFFKLSSAVTTTIPAANGTTLIAGDFCRVGGLPRNGVARITTTGAVDPQFTPPASGASIAAIMRQGDGKVLLSRRTGGVAVERLLVNGTLDPAFNANDGQWYNSPSALAIHADGKVYSGGDRWIARFNPNGTRDTSFAATEGSYPQEVHCVYLQNDGKALVGGTTTTGVGGYQRSYLRRLLADGTADGSFSPAADFTSTVRALLQEPDGTTVAGGDFGEYGSEMLNCVAWLSPDGSLLRGGDWETLGARLVSSLLWQADGRVIVSGLLWEDYGVVRHSLLRLDADGAKDLSFTVANVEESTTSGVCYDDDGRLLYSGATASRLGLTQTGLVRLKPGAAPEPRITQSPAASHCAPGATTALRFTAAGTGLHYVWYKDGVAIPNSDSATLSIPAATFADSGRYHAEACNTYGTVISAGAELVVTTETLVSYEDWATNEGLIGSAGYGDADPEGDGVTNFDHYAFKTSRGSGLVGNLNVSTVTDDGATYLAIAFARKTYATDVLYRVEATSDLTAWNWESVQTVPTGTPAEITVRDTKPINDASQRFLRVVVERVYP